MLLLLDSLLQEWIFAEMALMAIARPLRISSRSLTTTSRLQKDKDIDKERCTERQRLRYEAQKLGLGPQGALNPLTGRPISRSRGDEPWFQLPAVLGSLGAFLLYFVLLREENDWDESIGESMYYQQATGKVVRGEAEELVRSIAYYERQGWDSAPLRARQEELRRLAGEESKEVKELTRAIAYCEERGR